MARISPELAGIQIAVPATPAQQNDKLAVRQLFTDGRAAGTILLWIPFL